jgi:plasmid stabilization system protein ParE
MKFNLIYSPAAKEEFTEAAKWYEERSKGLGDQFLKAIEEKIKRIEENPDRYPTRRGYYRETISRKFPYVIVYRFNKSKHLITISSVYHTSRNPKNKYRR